MIFPSEFDGGFRISERFEKEVILMAYDRNDRRGGRKGRRKVCSFCVDKVETIDYKDVPRFANLFPTAPRSFRAV